MEATVGVRCLVFLLCSMGVAACQTTEGAWTDWQDISEQESLLVLETPAGTTLPQIDRQSRENKVAFVHQEKWAWNSGGAFVMILPRSSYMREEVYDKGQIIKDVKQWGYLEEIGFEADESMVQTAVNKVGVYHYLIGDKNTADRTCFMFRQMLDARAPAGYEDRAGGSRGFVVVLECQPTGHVDRERFKQRMLRLVENFRIKA